MSNKGSIVRKLKRLGLIDGIKPYQVETHYEVIMGSVAYGVSSDMSDTDVYGMYSTPLGQMFPHTIGHINGFGREVKCDDSYQKHHIMHDGREYDINLHSIVSYFNLCMKCTPNMIDSLFVPRRCIIHSDEVGTAIRDNRKMFLHKGIHHTLMGYANSQLGKLGVKKPVEGSKRYDSVMKYGYDVKFAYHVVRLVEQAQMVMEHGDLDLEANRELLKSIRRGDWTLEELKAWYKKREGELQTLYIESKLPLKADEDKVKELLFQCLEMHFGSLAKYFNLEGSNRIALDKMRRIRGIIEE
jgi:predicted nucleotidyltransferase